ncbi:MAG: HlyD family efflux transporter periplasmic adaptor subunit [Caldicoprobacter oshimai]|uniref:Putative membrane fusion protein n=1 Tax=Caldicoprobacter faecalis TaxID=937334 RepID=A0A1I5SEY4_9FIRM|nr:HlyD family efflux transporter periplasmic adaptor subunit [Caldicoprobacter faecalis]PZN11376.1 MAG: hypothetical protein DIU64_02975 [Caldicoprobacter oshimai]SFP69314.1 putative membrane fusion protein [Caldicoprobacter faecalis]
MGKDLVIGRRRVRFRFFVFLFMAIMGCYYLIYSSARSPVYGIVQYGEMLLKDRGDALVIRQESVYEAPEYGRVTFLVAEGEPVEKEAPVAVLYKANYKEELVYQLYNVQEKILSYQQENIVQEIIDKDLERVEKEIAGTVASIQIVVRDLQLDNLDDYEKRLRSLFASRQKILNQKMKPDPYLERLYKEESELNRQLEEWKVELVAPESGLISFSLDGMEDILGAKAVNYITIEDFKSFYGKDVWEQEDDGKEAKADQPFFKIVQPGKWYVACLISNSQINYVEGEEVDVSFIGPQVQTIKGRVYRVVEEKGEILVIVEFNEKVEDFINKRSVKVEISKNFQGFMVPADAVVTRWGEKGIKVVRENSETFIPVEVVASDGESAIIVEKGESKQLELHAKVRIER